MSIHVTDFKHEPGKNDAKYIELLEKTLKQEQAVTAKAVAKVRTQAKEIEEIRNKAIEEFANVIKNHKLAWSWCCHDEASELCDNNCSKCMTKFENEIDTIVIELKKIKETKS